MKAKSPGSKSPSTPPVPKSFHDRNLVPVSPLKEQFEPTEKEMVPQLYKMGGGA